MSMRRARQGLPTQLTGHAEVLPQRGPGVRRAAGHHVGDGAGDDHVAAGVAALGTRGRSIQSAARITSRLCSMTTSEWPAAISRPKASSSFATSSKCRAGRRLVEQEQRPACRAAVAARPRRRARGGIRQESGELQALRFAAGQRGHRLAEAQVVEPDRRQRRERRRHVAARRRRTRAPAPTVISSTSAIEPRRSQRSPRAPRRGSACRRSPGSADRRRTGTASPRARSRCRRRSGSGRCPS